MRGPDVNPSKGPAMAWVYAGVIMCVLFLFVVIPIYINVFAPDPFHPGGDPIFIALCVVAIVAGVVAFIASIVHEHIHDGKY
jgi:hypothetical protein